MHNSLIQAFPQAEGIINTVVRDYSSLILGCSSSSDPCFFEILEEETVKKIQNKERLERLSENAECFSQDSETPICLASAAGHNVGEIVRRNFFFTEAENFFGHVTSVQDLLPPEMRESHSKAMLKFAEKDGLISSH